MKKITESGFCLSILQDIQQIFWEITGKSLRGRYALYIDAMVKYITIYGDIFCQIRGISTNKHAKSACPRDKIIENMLISMNSHGIPVSSDEDGLSKGRPKNPERQ